MLGDKLIHNGTLCDSTAVNTDIDRLLEMNYVYQNIHVTGNYTPHLSIHSIIAKHTYATLFGKQSTLSEQTLNNDIDRLMKANLCRDFSYQVRLYMSEQDYILTCYKQLLYRGYVLWHTRPTALLTPYENPFTGCPNASSLINSVFAAEFARRSGADIALTQNYDRILVGSGDNPLFAVQNDVVMITPINYGATDSVERRIGIKAAYKAGLEVIEQPLLSKDIINYQELFTFDTQGIISIFSIGQTRFFNLIAERIAQHLEIETNI